MAPRRVVVVGGGITGLTAAYRLLHPFDTATAVPTVVLIDSAERLGGKILTTPFEGRPVDEGADAFLLRVRWAIELCTELGISAERISPAVGGASVAHPGTDGPQLTPLPDGLIGGVPTRLRPLLRSPLLGRAGALRAAADYAMPRRRREVDASASVGDIVRSRLGDAVARRVVDPLLGSISAGDIDQIDAATSAPMLIEALQRNRSLMRGLRQMQPAGAPSGETAMTPAPIFGSFSGGMGRLTDELRGRLDTCDIRLSTPVTAVRREGARLTVETPGEPLIADAVVVAAPAHAAAPMLASAPDAAAGLSGIEYASVAVLTLGVRAGVLESPREAGFLVTRDNGWLTTACSFGSAKWPHWSGGDRTPPNDTAPSVVLRVSVGRADDDRHTHLDDAALRDAVLTELSRVPSLHGLGTPGAVTAWRVSRWEQSLPQYRPGHGRLVERIEAALARELPGVVIAGAAYRGLGVPACIRQGNEAAAAVAQHLGADRVATSS